MSSPEISSPQPFETGIRAQHLLRGRPRLQSGCVWLPGTRGTRLALRDLWDTCPSPSSQGHRERPTAGPLHANPIGKASAWLIRVRAGLQQAGASSPHCKRGLLAKIGAQSWQRGWGAAAEEEWETCPQRQGAEPLCSGGFASPPRVNLSSSPQGS